MKRWMYRRCGQANASPAMFVLGLLIVLAITVYVYHEIIIQTLIYLAEGIGLILAITGGIAIAVNARRYQKRRTQRAIASALTEAGDPAASQVIDGHLEPTVLPDRTAMERTARRLADGDVELFFDADGNLRSAKDK